MSTAAMATVTGGTAALHLPPKPPTRESFTAPKHQISYKQRTKLLSFSSRNDRNPRQEPSQVTSASTRPVAEDQEEEKVKESGSGEDGVVLPTMVQDSDNASFISSGGCKACGKEVVESGCNGEGRIQGGIATVPGFGWWPIKAYRPCPAFVASGGRYRRSGQSMDEVVSGGAQRANAARINDNSESRNKKRGSKKFNE